MKFSHLLLVWLVTGAWTVTTTHVALSLEVAHYRATDSTVPAQVAYWVAALGIPVWLGLGSQLLAKVEALEKTPAASPAGMSGLFVLGSTFLFWILMFLLVLNEGVGRLHN